MASARKKFKPKGNSPSEAHVFRAFIGDLLSGTIVATRCHEQRDGRGRLIELEYDDPNGAAARVDSQARALAPLMADPLDEASPVSFAAPAVPKPSTTSSARARRKK